MFGICYCSTRDHIVPVTDQSLRTLLNRWAASLNKQGEALPALTDAEYADMLIFARKAEGLVEALQYVKDK